jgi:RimJ/RimL family protein N-acetyltransferase
VAHPVWPFFDLRVVTPRLELRAIDDELGVQLAQLAAKGIHDPSWMPFGIPWTDYASPELERNAMQFYWRCRADLTAESWNLNFAVIEDGELVGSTGLFAHNFPTLRQFETGSWLGRDHQGRGIGKEMRQATLHIGFAGFGAEWATTGAFTDNAPSLGVTRRLGYSETGHRRQLRRDESGTLLTFEMSRADWEANLHRDDIELHGVEACLPMLGLSDG